MTTDREALRALAEAALSPRDGDYEYERLDTREGHALAAALDPQTVLAILDERDALRAALPEDPWVWDDLAGERICYSCAVRRGVGHAKPRRVGLRCRWDDARQALARAASPGQGL